MTKKRVGVVLSGCGHLDGAEIHEATLTLLSLDRRGAGILGMAPAAEQMHVIDHVTRKPVSGVSRNVMAESARIMRGEVKDIATVNARDLDALVFPGGFGAAKNLCSFAIVGAKMTVNDDVARLVKAMHEARKPMGFICIAPVIAARVLGQVHPVLTIGDDRDTAAALVAMGARHEVRKVDDICVDQANRIVTTPAYMLGPTIAAVAQGIDKLVSAVLEMA